MTEPEPLQQVDRSCVLYRGRKFSCFSGCDYFRLSSHPSVLKAARVGLEKFGLNVAASRLTTGNHAVYKILERELADFFEAEAALLVPAGYVAALVVGQALAGTYSHVLVDERAHPALLDAARLLDCPVLKFKHRNPGDFARSAARCGPGARLLALTDGMFSRDGSVAPLRAYLKSLPRDGWIVVDDAHGAGVLGRTGKGSIEAEGVGRGRIIQCITLSKAFGSFGGAVLGSSALRNRILMRSRLFLGCTPPPLPLACAALAALRILRNDRSMRGRLQRNSIYVKEKLRCAGFDLPRTPGPIVPVRVSSKRKIAGLKRRLLDAGIYPPFLKYPGAPAEGYFRFVISSEHSRAQLDRLLEVLTRRPGVRRRPANAAAEKWPHPAFVPHFSSRASGRA